MLLQFRSPRSREPLSISPMSFRSASSPGPSHAPKTCAPSTSVRWRTSRRVCPAAAGVIASIGSWLPTGRSCISCGARPSAGSSCCARSTACRSPSSTPTWPASRSTSTGRKRGWRSSSTARETHLTRHAFHADRRRDRALAVEGMQTLRVTWPDLAAPLAQQVLAILPAALISMVVPDFKVNPAYTPVADQPKARDGARRGHRGGDRFQTLLGVTGSGKTATMAFTIEQVQRPALVIAHNKTLAAQLCNEFREFFPDNAVEYFVSYYDYYQPEAYVPAQDLYIEKDSSINEEIERLRHAATAALFARRDVIVVASVSCIYGLGSPEKYDAPDRCCSSAATWSTATTSCASSSTSSTRATTQALGRGSFRVRGETLEVFPAYAETAYRAVFFGDEIEAVQRLRPAHRRGAQGARARRRSGRPPTTRPTARRSSARSVEIRDELEQRTQGARGAGQAARVAPAAPAHAVRHGDAARARLLQRDRELLAHPRRPRRRRAALLPARLLPRRLRLLHRRVAPDRPADRRHVRGRPLAQADAGRLRLPAPERARQPAADLRRVPRAHARRSCSSRPRRATSSATTRAGSSSRSCARPAWSTPRSTCARPRTRSTT